MRIWSMTWILLFCVGSGCSGNDATTLPSQSSSTNGGANGPDAGGVPTFHQVYADVISSKCTTCHAPGEVGVTAGHLDMGSENTAFESLVGQNSAGVACSGHGVRVVPGNPDSSVMYLKISLDDPSPCGDKMPFGGPPLSQAEVDEIEAWIDEGAVR